MGSSKKTGPDGKGSLFCSYNEKSQNYNSSRRPLGMDIILGAICMTGVPLTDIHLLDIGCGTGSFISMMSGITKHVTGLEINNGMLAKAKRTLQSELESGKVRLVQGAAINLDFEQDTFHVVTMNVVAHHFPPENNFAYLKSVFGKVYEVLKPGGCFVMTHALPHQNTDGQWYAPLLPKSVEDMNVRSATLEVISGHLREVGFTVKDEEIVTPLRGTFMSEDWYLAKYGINGAFVQEYRDGDSTWAIAETNGELDDCQAAIRKMQSEGTADKWLEMREELRKRTGQATFFTARKPTIDTN